MHERQAEIVLLVRAFEEVDGDGRVLPHERRADATRRARERAGDRDDALLGRRAAILGKRLTDTFPTLPRLLRLARLSPVPAPAVVGTALVAGLLTNALGQHREVNLLSLPLMGLLVWNLFAYLALSVTAAGLTAPTRGLTTRFHDGLLNRLRGWRPPGRRGDSDARVLAAAVARFVDLWRRHAGRLLAVRARLVLHLAAVTFAAGVLGGMYLRGLVFAYQATWESTFLEAGTVQSLLNGILGPAAFLLDVEVPEVAPLRGPGGGGDAAPWIHLYAVTAALVVLLPRTVLAWACALRARRMAASLPLNLDAGYFRRVLAARRGKANRVDILPYGYEPGPAITGRLKGILHDLFGARADIRVQAPLTYGEDRRPTTATAPAANEGEACLAALFSLAQSPEVEVHGRFLETLKAGLGRGARLVVLVDATKYRRRVDAPERWAERSRAWRRVVREAGLTAVVLDLDEEEERGGDGVLDAMALALWPTPEEARG
jgi:hypothetical protein